ncbi:hypothetical protein FDP41_007458 [Naegleria fowleri]|uniref:Uncharacterized protein n=1 Tax=Naegleria fowleri TaxID=5763 RepID=A0A6A5CAL2_NAEFO|nr:uncharacterized protein FDP41_007458 [Naegleria fowleri]KAF0984281.1 hypothetical protein FDP41_007458 [Naegleria fowleri]
MTKIHPQLSPRSSDTSFFSSVYSITPLDLRQQNVVDANQTNNETVLPTKKKTLSSILCLSLLTIIIAIASVQLLSSSVWIALFSSSMSTSQSKYGSKLFEKITLHINSTLLGALMISENVKESISTLDVNNVDDGIAQRLLKSSNSFLPTPLLNSIYFGDGTLGMSLTEMTRINSNNTVFAYCQDKECKEMSSLNVKATTFNQSHSLQILSLDGPSCSLSYFDNILTNRTILSCITFHLDNQTSQLDWYFGFDISTDTLSRLLADSIAKSDQSTAALILETETEHVIATNTPILRNDMSETIHSLKDASMREIGLSLYENVNRNLRSISCSKIVGFSIPGGIIRAHRMCEESGLDWIIVLHESTYQQELTIGIIIASLINTGIGLIGIIIGVVVTVKIVQPLGDIMNEFSPPFQTLLDKSNFHYSNLKEIREVQTNFTGLIDLLKKYRSVIPPHVLTKLDAPKEAINTRDSTREKLQSHNSDFSIVSSRSLKGDDMVKPFLHHALDQRRITVALFYLEGFEACMKELYHTDVVSILNDFLNVVQKVCETSNGHLGQFQNNMATISWNSANEVLLHEQQGLISSKQVLEKLIFVQQSKWRQSSIPSDVVKMLNFKSAILSQDVLCGAIGTSQWKSVSIVGSNSFNLDLILKHALKLDVDIIVTDDILRANNSSFCHRFVGTKMLYDFDEIISPYSSTKDYINSMKKKPTKLYQIGEAIEQVTTDIEWMYELQSSINRSEKWKYYNDGVNYMLEGNNDYAMHMFKIHMANYRKINEQDDKVATYMMKKCATNGKLKKNSFMQH